MTSSKLKVYELAKELGQESQHLVEVIQRLGIDIKNSMSVLGSEEVRTVREHFKKQKSSGKGAASPASRTPVTEKRVGSTVIRRRSPAASSADASASTEAATEAPAAERHAPLEARSKAPSMQAPPEPEVEEQEEEEIPEAVEAAEAEEPEDEPQVEVAPPVAATPKPAAPVARPVAPILKTTAAPKAPAPTPRAPVAASKAPMATSKPVINAAPMAPKPQAVPTPPPQPVTPPKARRVFPSIIKKVGTEEHLVEKVGPKVEKRERPVKPPDGPGVRKPPITGVRPPGATPPGQGLGTGPLGLRRGPIKEVEVAPSAEAAREATKRKLMERTNTVFKSADYLKRELVHATKKKKAIINRPAMKTQITKPAEHKRVVEMPDSISVAELAREMGIKAAALVSKLMAMGVTATMNQSIDHDTATLVAHEFGFEIKQKVFKEEDFLPTLDVSEEKMKTRPPVVTIMGHVDHGKTSLLDAIRKTKVAAGEAGGITQHIGAYQVQTDKGKVTFLDTPGHEAFTAMRSRGAKVTDIVIIVVSAVDGVMPQTLESVNHAKAAEVPIIVAINKIDLPDGNPDRVKQTLAGHNLNPEEWGGDTIYVPVSAKTGKGLDQLLEAILLQAEILELKANFDAPARGKIVEARLDKNRGPVATILVQHGTLRAGDVMVCGTMFGKVRAMTNSMGQKVSEAGPSEPVELLGLPEVPNVGDDIFAAEDDKKARELVEARTIHLKVASADGRPKMSLADMMAAAQSDKEVRVILRADVQGSAEALREALSKFPTEKVKLKILHTGSGGVSESDIHLASASQAVILGFNIRPDLKAMKLAEQESVVVRTYTVIYDLLEDVKKLLEGQLDKIIKEKVIGRAEVREVFSVPKVGVIAGSAVIDGKVLRGCFLRLLRDNRVVYTGKISSLRRFKEDVKEVAQGYECGIGLENFNDVKLGDQFEAFLKEESLGTL